METVIRNIGDLRGSQRSAAELLVGHALREDQQLVIQVVNLDTDKSASGSKNASVDEADLPEWCNVYQGLTDDEIAALEKAILHRLDLTRPAI